MSWEAVSWANRQTLKKTYEQCVLLVLANCADPNGEAFVKWPGKEHWWVYLSKRTRLPKSSLFRHLNTIVALGLGERTMQVLADGSRRPTFKLDLAASFNIDDPEDQAKYDAVFARTSAENQSPVETDSGEGEEHDENGSDISTSHAGDAPIAPQSPVETENPPAQSPAGTGPFPVLRPQEDSKLLSKNSPLPPSGGASAPDEGWEEFCKVWREPMQRQALARSAWDHIETAKRPEATAAARGYFAWLGQQKKPPTAVSAQTFLRDQAGWAQWLRYVPADSGGAAAPVDQFDANSREGRAIAMLYEIAGKADFFRQVKCRGGKVYYANPITPRLLALADAPKKTEWVKLETRHQAAAWEGLLSEGVQVMRPRLAEGSIAPWLWPPRKDGTLSPTGPPDSLMNDQDFENFK